MPTPVAAGKVRLTVSPVSHAWSAIVVENVSAEAATTASNVRVTVSAFPSVAV